MNRKTNKTPRPEVQGSPAPKSKNGANAPQQTPAKQSPKTRTGKVKAAVDALPAYPAPETVGGHEPPGKTRRRSHNRRRKDDAASSEQLAPLHPMVDAEKLTAHAWKIFKGEVKEEGLALMDDSTAAETARRAFRVAELFLIEAAAHRPEDERP